MTYSFLVGVLGFKVNLLVLDLASVLARILYNPLAILGRMQIARDWISRFHFTHLSHNPTIADFKSMSSDFNDKYHMVKIFIHGANATPKSWNYIRSQIGDGILISYNSANGFKNNLTAMKAQLNDVEDMQFIAHSLGGIYALHLADHFGDRVKCGISLSTPYGGVNVPMVARYYLYWHKLFHDIIPTAWPIATVNDIKLRWPWTNIVSVSGSMPWAIEPNDGVVTIESQRHRNDMELIELDCNHYEIVLSDQTVELIKARL